MGRFAYYSPFVLGVLLTLLMQTTLYHARPVMPEWAWPWYLAGIAAAVGLAAQLALVGTQGVFAQVLPVPGGRSVRGPNAVTGGWLLLATVAGIFATGLLLFEGARNPGLIAGGATIAVGIAATIVYAWGWPAAVTDFADEDRPGRRRSSSGFNA